MLMWVSLISRRRDALSTFNVLLWRVSKPSRRVLILLRLTSPRRFRNESDDAEGSLVNESDDSDQTQPGDSQIWDQSVHRWNPLDSLALLVGSNPYSTVLHVNQIPKQKVRQFLKSYRLSIAIPSYSIGCLSTGIS